MRLVLLFSVVAVTPSIVVDGVRQRVLQPGHPILFDDRIRSALDGSLSVARSSLEEHRNNIRADALGVAISLQRASTFGNTQVLQQVLDQETTFHGLIQAVIFDPLTHQVIAVGRRAERQFRRAAHRPGD